MDRARVTVSQQELENALATWMAVAPHRLFTQLEKQFLLRADKRAGDPLPAFRAELASFCADKLCQAGWEITRPDRTGPLFG